jgi:hypothetical protein
MFYEIPPKYPLNYPLNFLSTNAIPLSEQIRGP